MRGIRITHEQKDIATRREPLAFVVEELLARELARELARKLAKEHGVLGNKGFSCPCPLACPCPIHNKSQERAHTRERAR